MDSARADYVTEIFQLTSPLFLFLTSFRRKVRKGVRVELSEASNRLDEIFAAMAREAREDPKLDALYEKVRYPLVVLADEILLQSGWEHADLWDSHLLEGRLFGSNIGGEKYFTIANEIRSEDTELAAILYTGIALGFGGKYRERPEKLADVRQRLYRLNAEYVASFGDKITPAAYHVDPTPARRLSPLINLYRVLIVAFGILVLYYALTFALWSSSLSELRAAARAIGVE
ncbi:MAG TPA: DotU family type IV/VI secretion system protein [Thermoanaerobaculia bacterium]|nr:DotU family type IV/VI secretion system protein [Thermoanaerobaculia bacterium]HXM79448.1 DotU family type IV/VI secretion system protein [Thermoanaerobaculia bacterium]